MVSTVVEKPIVRGAPKKLAVDLLTYKGERRVFEYMIDGPRGTGKTVGVGFVLRAFCDEYPGLRVLFVRKTRRSISESFCPDFEAVVCGGEDECLTGVKPEGRSAYRWDSTGSSIVLRGMDDPHKSYSTSYDVIVVEEAFEFTEDEFEQFRAMLRNWCGGMRWQLLLALTNPRHPKHWLLERVRSGRMTRYKSTHADNPKWYKLGFGWTEEGRAYNRSLKSMTGIRYRRLYKGEWCAAEGAVWESWEEKYPEGHALAGQPHHVIPAEPTRETVDWYCAGMDWGHTDPCSFLIAAVQGKGVQKRLTVVREIYQSKRSIQWWTEQVVEAFAEYRMPVLVVDPSRPEIIEYFNRALCDKYPELRDRPIARPADNERHAASPKSDLAGLDLVREYIDTDRLFVWENRIRHGADEILRERHKPLSLLDEIPEYVYKVPSGAEDTRDARDQTDPKCADHACDALRYLVTAAHKYDLGRVPNVVPREGTARAIFGPKPWEVQRRRRA